jgi:hypothetical protein
MGDIHVSFDYGNSHCFPWSFIDTTKEGQLTFTGLWGPSFSDWEVEELEVFGLYNPNVLNN